MKFCFFTFASFVFATVTMEADHMPYEGAGFLLRYQNDFILGIRIKKPEDVAKDPTIEIEYMGGKPDQEDLNNPLKTAYAELVEEIGTSVLDPDWESRRVPIHTFQKFSKKWIHCELLDLNATEYNRIVAADLVHDQWDVKDTRDLSAITGRATPVRKAISAFVRVSAADLTRYIADFALVPNSGNRMTDAKEYRNSAKPITATRLSTGDTSAHPMRAFNTVIFEEHVAVIQKK
jgi:hypothetical protein